MGSNVNSSTQAAPSSRDKDGEAACSGGAVELRCCKAEQQAVVYTHRHLQKPAVICMLTNAHAARHNRWSHASSQIKSQIFVQ